MAEQVEARHAERGTDGLDLGGKAVASVKAVNDVALPSMAPTPQDRGDALAEAMTGGQIGRFRGVLQGFDDEPLTAGGRPRGDVLKVLP
ncbi:MAG: hypothetical protein EOP35_24785 [Rubrivivax sp.]|nr:MAG: hypothetical protein EOP35_24785 [Rubrivivax sp.]